MDFFEENKALIITVLLFAVLLLAMYNINISKSNQKVRETLIELNDLRPEEPREQEQQQQEQQPEPPESQRPNLETHQAFNQNQEESQENFESRLDEIFQKNSASQEASEEETSSTQGDLNLEPNRRQKKQQASEGKGTSEEISTRQGTLRNSSISFSLIGRSALDIPNPIYTCDTPGKIVVNIRVNADGEVIDTSVNKKSSTSSNECLIDNALEYARGARFSQLPGRNSQPGTITYNFQD